MSAPGLDHSRMEPLWDRVDKNRFKLVLSVVLFAAGATIGLDLVVMVFLGAGYLLWWQNPVGLAVIPRIMPTALLVASIGGVVVSLVWAAFSLSRSEKWLLRRLNATLVPKGELLPTKYALKDMAIAAGLPSAPTLYVLDTFNVNAFVFAHSKRRPVVGVTRGLVERLSVDEQRAVFANLVARIRSGDTIFATGITALTRPLWAMRDGGFRDQDLTTAVVELEDDPVRSRDLPIDTASAAPALWWLFAVGWVFVIVTELVAFGHRRSQLRMAEVADAEGMLLLKDPASMLAATEKAVRFNNFVPTAGPGFAQLFYCWTGDSTDDEDDPEVVRILRLREVLGVEGMSRPQVEPNIREFVMAPPAPWLEEREPEGL